MAAKSVSRLLKFFGQLYDVEREISDSQTERRKEVRQQRSRPVADALHQWLVQQRQKVPDGSATAKAIDLDGDTHRVRWNDNHDGRW